MPLLERYHPDISNGGCSVDHMCLAYSGIATLRLEDIIKPTLENIQRLRVSIYRQPCACGLEKPAQVINAVGVVGMIMCIENRIQCRNLGGKHLLPQVRRCVNKQCRIALLYQHAGTAAPVFWVFRVASPPILGHFRDAT